MSESHSARLITSRSEFQEAVKEAFVFAAERGAPQFYIADPNFADWPLGDRSVLESLTRWAYRHRKLIVLAERFDEFPKRHVRWMDWRRQWSHVVECRQVDEADLGQLVGTMIVPQAMSLRVLDAEHHRASLSFDTAEAVRVFEGLDAVLQRSEEGFPVTTLGL